MSTVSNASPLIALAAIGQLRLLPGLFGSITIPPAVAAEIAPSIAARPEWLDVQPLAHWQPTQIQGSGLGAGEREALSLGLEGHADRVILDDLPARRLAHALGLRVIGTLGVLLAAKRRGLRLCGLRVGGRVGSRCAGARRNADARLRLRIRRSV